MVGGGGRSGFNGRSVTGSKSLNNGATIARLEPSMKGTRRGWWHYASGYDAHDPGARWEEEEEAAAAATAGGFEMDGGSAIVLNVPMDASGQQVDAGDAQASREWQAKTGATN